MPCSVRGDKDQKEVLKMDNVKSYETMFVISPALDEEATAEMVNKFKTLIETHGTVESVEEWGKRKLAYPIDDFTEGYYVLINFQSGPDFPEELTRVYKITEGILRSMIISK